MVHYRSYIHSEYDKNVVVVYDQVNTTTCIDFFTVVVYIFVYQYASYLRQAS